MSVSAAHRRRGLGRCVVNELVARARRRETTELRILTDTPRTSAAALCQASGLTQLGDDELEIDRHLGMNLGRSS